MLKLIPGSNVPLINFYLQTPELCPANLLKDTIKDDFDLELPKSDGETEDVFSVVDDDDGMTVAYIIIVDSEELIKVFLTKEFKYLVGPHIKEDDKEDIRKPILKDMVELLFTESQVRGFKSCKIQHLVYIDDILEYILQICGYCSEGFREDPISGHSTMLQYTCQKLKSEKNQ